MVFLHIFIICFALTFIEGAEFTVPKKCDDVSDNKCMKLVFQNIYSEVAQGDPSLDIPSLDPIVTKDAVFVLPNLIKVTLGKEIITGLRNCVADKFEASFNEPMNTQLELLCNIEINGDSVIEIPKSVMKELGGEDVASEMISGRGRLNIEMEKLRFHFNIPFTIERRNNFFVKFQPSIIRIVSHDTSVLSIDNLDVGNKVNNKIILNYLKEHADELNVTGPIVEKVQSFFRALAQNYLTKFPLNNVFTDLSILSN